MCYVPKIGVFFWLIIFGRLNLLSGLFVFTKGLQVGVLVEDDFDADATDDYAQEYSKQNVRITNIVFNRRRTRNLTDSKPAIGAFCGKIGTGPFTKNLVMPKEAVKRLRIKEYTDSGISLLLLPKASLG